MARNYCPRVPGMRASARQKSNFTLITWAPTSEASTVNLRSYCLTMVRSLEDCVSRVLLPSIYIHRDFSSTTRPRLSASFPPPLKLWCPPGEYTSIVTIYESSHLPSTNALLSPLLCFFSLFASHLSILIPRCSFTLLRIHVERGIGAGKTSAHLIQI